MERSIRKSKHFNPLPLYRGRLWHIRKRSIRLYISILSLYTEGDVKRNSPWPLLENFNPLPLYRGRRNTSRTINTTWHFNPLPLYRGRLIQARILALSQKFQSSPSIQRETSTLILCIYASSISILSLYTEGDDVLSALVTAQNNFNPLPLYRGRRRQNIFIFAVFHFNPLPLYRGRRINSVSCFVSDVISILSLYTEGDRISILNETERNISILSLYTEGDFLPLISPLKAFLFQSSPSIQRETPSADTGTPLPYLFQSSPSIQRETVQGALGA